VSVTNLPTGINQRFFKFRIRGFLKEDLIVKYLFGRFNTPPAGGCIFFSEEEKKDAASIVNAKINFIKNPILTLTINVYKSS
jgi:hypothetical protein